MKKTFITKGFHSNQTWKLFKECFDNNDLLIICPPNINDVNFFVPFLPESEISLQGNFKQFDKSLLCKTSFKDDPVLGIFTTGTTRTTPKLVLYSKDNVLHTLKGIMTYYDRSRVKSIFCYPQPYHVFGLIFGYVFSHHNKFNLIFSEGEHSPFTHMKWLEIDKSTRKNMLTLGTPTHFGDLIYYINKKNITPDPSYSSVAGGAKVDTALWDQMKNILNIESPSIGYGCTEASLGVLHLPPGVRPQEEGELGTIIPGIDLEIIENKGIEVRGKSVCLAMINDNKIEFPEKILITDIVKKRDDGMIVYHGREQLLLNRGGEKYSLEQIENHILKTRDLHCICVQVRDDRLGEELGIIIKSDPLDKKISEKLFQSLKKQFGKNFNPSYVKYVNSFPINSSSKIDREKCSVLFINRQFPIKTELLRDFLPHRPPMVWIDQVESVNDLGGTCLVKLDPLNHCFDSNGKLRQSSFLEFLAQGYGFVEAAREITKKDFVSKKAPKRAFLAGVRNLKVFNTANIGDSIIIEVSKIRQLESLTLAKGVIKKHNSDKIIASGDFKIFAE